MEHTALAFAPGDLQPSREPFEISGGLRLARAGSDTDCSRRNCSLLEFSTAACAKTLAAGSAGG